MENSSKNPTDVLTDVHVSSTAQFLSSPQEENEENARAIDKYDGISHAVGYNSSFDNMLPGISGRPEFNRGHYDYFRPGEAAGKKYQETINAIDNVYDSLSIVKSMIDLMSDFASEGIDIVHPVPAVEKFYKEWFKKIDASERSERFLSGMYRHGMVVVRQLNGKVRKKGMDKLAMAGEVNLKKIKTNKNDIPLKYLFYNPGRFRHENYRDITSTPIYKLKGESSSDLSTVTDITLPSDRIYVAYYKKDDWKEKPTPFLTPVIKHAVMLEKLNLADSAALDGAISKVRIFKLGDMDKGLFPSDSIIGRLDSILRSNVGGGTMDLIWGPDIEMIESDTDIHKFLGQAKYDPHLSQVYEGLGIPASFVGGGSGTTNNYISLKILTRRLMCGRQRLTNFWNEQIKLVQLAMGFAEPATLEFNHLDLGDEQSERQLLVQLVDRDIISSERLQKILGFDPRMENKRVKRETKDRESGRMPEKASQFHSPETREGLIKLALDKGYYGPEHVGLTKAPGSEDILTPKEQAKKDDKELAQTNNKLKNTTPNTDKPRKGSGGRPQGAKDKVKRKVPEFKPKIKASIDIWASTAQSEISEILKDVYLKSVGKKRLNSLTASEISQFELVKFGVILCMDPFQKINKDAVITSLGESIPKEALKTYNEMEDDIRTAFGRVLSVDEIRSIYRNLYIQSVQEVY